MIPPGPRVGPFFWTCIYDPGLDEEFGETRYPRLEIALAAGLPDDLERETYHHELWHTCAYTAGLEDDKKYTPEEFIKRASPLYLDALRRDPAVRDFLFS